MCTSEEKFFTPLSASEYRLLDVLCLLSKDGVATPTMEELARNTQSSEESVRRALRKLEEVGLLKVERTKRNFGKFNYNKYFLLSPSHKNVDLPSHKSVEESVEPSHKNVGSTHDHIYSNDIDNNKEIKTTSLFMFEPEHKKRTKEIVLKGWQDDDAELSGFGLFDDEVPASKKPEKVSKRSSKTRNLRPQEEWTALDVAAEFASKVYAKLPGAMNVVNTVQLQKILSKNRKQFNLTPIIELEVMRLFLEDNWFKTSARSYPQYVQGRFLKFFTSHLSEALKNLGLHSDLSITEEHAMSASGPEFVYASDGTRFDNSMPGRYDLMRYEEKLRRANDSAAK
jgi:DNA-binding transcriptional ArsR family regulator